jgi:glycolate oxidase FAD binding subunit
MIVPDTATDVARDLAAIAGAASVRLAAEDDTIHGVPPSLVVAPETPERLAAVLAWASERRAPLVLRGGGTRLSYGRTPAPFDLVVTTERLNRILRHEPGDLTVSVEAGLPLASLNRALAAQGQWLPLDVPGGTSTIGGLLAVNDSGPLRHRHGAPRDLLIGIHLATADGRLVKSGGNVVKNVAGYDLGRLMCGSFGSLAAIVSATFKLAPAPADFASLVAEFTTSEALAAASAAVGASQIDPLCAHLRARADTRGDASTDVHLLVRFAGTAAINDAQLDDARRLVMPHRPSRVEACVGDAEARLWDAQTRGPWISGGTLLTLSWLPAAIGGVVDLLNDLARARSVTAVLTGRAALGTGLIQLEGDVQQQAAAIAQLRDRSDVVRHVVIARADATLRSLVDPWGPGGETMALLQSIKATLDPAGVLNAGRGVI